MISPDRRNLTSRQRETYEWVKTYMLQHHMPPTVREIGAQFGIKSSSVHALLKALERKGYLERDKRSARGLHLCNEGVPVQQEAEGVPVIGRIAAGQPILAVEDPAETVTVNRRLVRGRKTYALRVQGDSMIDAGILDGDHVIIRKQDTAGDGDIVVALIGEEATLKRLYREKDGVRLEAANEAIEPIYVDSGEFRIQGKVVAVIRIMT